MLKGESLLREVKQEVEVGCFLQTRSKDSAPVGHSREERVLPPGNPALDMFVSNAV